MLSKPLILLTLTTLTTAIPVSSAPTTLQEIRLPAPTPTVPTTASATADTKASQLTHELATLLAHDASESYDPTTCPISHASRQCCTSITKLADDLSGQLGELVPWVGGVRVSSLVGLQCKSMAEETPNVDCTDTVMCCSSGVAGSGGKTQAKAGTQSLFMSGCIPYDKAIEDKKKAIEKSKMQASAMAAMGSSSGPTPTATPMSRAYSLSRV
ncbi:uncharacterized protein BJX67DRAFT_262756 [Aspergillus lucknowensis]|uniref:Hydrophobin n=1 Tax=Aspergillus lucknowensis TaxID=176173 RepID=A0ABR4LFI8_9EURO